MVKQLMLVLILLVVVLLVSADKNAVQAAPIDASGCIQDRIEYGPAVSSGDRQATVWLTNRCNYVVRLVVCSVVGNSVIPHCSLVTPLRPNGDYTPWTIGYGPGESFRYRFRACADPVPGKPHHSYSTCHPGQPTF